MTEIAKLLTPFEQVVIANNNNNNTVIIRNTVDGGAHMVQVRELQTLEQWVDTHLKLKTK